METKSNSNEIRVNIPLCIVTYFEVSEDNKTILSTGTKLLTEREYEDLKTTDNVYIKNCEKKSFSFGFWDILNFLNISHEDYKNVLNLLYGKGMFTLNERKRRRGKVND